MFSVMHTVGLAVSDGMPLFELAAPTAVLGSRPYGYDGDWYSMRAHAPVGAGIDGWLTVSDSSPWEELRDCDTVVVPACHDRALRPHPELVESVRAAHDAGARIVSICTGAFVLAEAGLLDGRRATTHWEAADLFRRRFPAVRLDPDVLYVDEGRVLTSAGKAAGMDLMLHLVRQDHGATVANRVARHLVTPPHRGGGQAQFVDHGFADGPRTGLAPLLDWAIDHLDQVSTVAQLARHANTTTRTLNRRFHTEVGESPQRWLHRQRILRAQHMLEGTDDTVEGIAHACGFGTDEAFRRQFDRIFGTTPSDYRRTFRGRVSPAAGSAGSGGRARTAVSPQPAASTANIASKGAGERPLARPDSERANGKANPT